MHAAHVKSVNAFPPLPGEEFGAEMEQWFTTPPSRKWRPSQKTYGAPTRRPPGIRRHEQGAPCLLLLKLVTRPAKVANQSPERPPGIGIDLATRGMEVRKLFYAAFARGLVKDGYDPEEALQEVYRGLLARNNGTCPLDTKKSSFGHYVHIVTRCVLANYIRKEKRRTQFESNESQMSPRSAGEDAFQVQEQVDKRRGVKIEPGSLERLSEKLAARHGAGVQAALQMLSEGHPVRKVVATLGVERMWLDEVLADAKSQLTE